MMSHIHLLSLAAAVQTASSGFWAKETVVFPGNLMKSLAYVKYVNTLKKKTGDRGSIQSRSQGRGAGLEHSHKEPRGEADC